MGNTLKTVRHFSFFKSSSTSVEKTDFETCKIFGLVNQKGQPVPLKSIQVTVNILGCLAEVESSLNYQNEEDHPIEAAFTFPVDDGSAVFHFEANIDGRCIVAEIQEKEQAILTYKDAKKHGKTAMLLKEDDKSSDNFQCLLGNLRAHSAARLVIKYVRELAQEYDGKVSFSLPTVLNPRYSPDAGGTIAAEGATYVAPSKVKYQFSMQARVEGYHKVVSVTSERMKLNIQHEQDHKVAKVTLAEDFTFDHDLCFLVEYDKPFLPQVLFEAGNPEADGLLKEDIVMLSFRPELKTVGMAVAGEYIFIVDRSGSMSGQKILNAQEALLLCIKSLPTNCYFNVISFGHSFSSLFESGSQHYSNETSELAVRVIMSMKADMGGTEIFQPLQDVYKNECIEGNPRRIFVLTDGEVTNLEEVIGLVKKHAHTARLFALGIGDGVSTSLVKGIARAGGGDAEFIADQDRLQPKVISLLKKAMQPSISGIEIKLELPPYVTSILIPSEPPTVITSETRMTVFALLQNVDHKVNAPGMVVLKGQTDKEYASYNMNFVLHRECETNKSAPVHRLATKTQIQRLQDQINEINQENNIAQKQAELTEIRQKIVTFSRHGNIVSKYSAFVAVDNKGKKVKGIDIQRSCPVPTLSKEFLDGLQKADSLVYVDLDFRSSKKRPTLRKTIPKHSFFEINGSSVEKGVICYEEIDFTQKESRNCYILQESQNQFPTVAVSIGNKMLAVIALQNVFGNWTMSDKLLQLLDVSKQVLESSNIVTNIDVMCTLAVIAWLMKTFSANRDEWQIIETKAFSWLATQNLNTSVDDLLKQTTDTLWPAS